MIVIAIRNQITSMTLEWHSAAALAPNRHRPIETGCRWRLVLESQGSSNSIPSNCEWLPEPSIAIHTTRDKFYFYYFPAGKIANESLSINFNINKMYLIEIVYCVVLCQWNAGVVLIVVLRVYCEIASPPTGLRQERVITNCNWNLGWRRGVSVEWQKLQHSITVCVSLNATA